MPLRKLMNTLDQIMMLMEPDARKLKLTICETCNEPVLHRRRTKKYCSPACKQKAYRQRQAETRRL
jgi:formylmethanofuran dehydrogenase subunit E